MKRPSEFNQQIAKSIRPQLPRDGTPEMRCWYPGDLPRGGYRSVIPMGPNKEDTKLSPTSGGGKKVY